MKITIINQYCENRGDEAAGTALVKNLLAMPEVERIDIIYNSAYHLDLMDSRVFHRNKDLALKKIGKKGIFDYLMFHKCNSDAMREMAHTISESNYIFVTPCGASLGIYKDWPFLIRLLFVIKEKKTPIFCLNTINSSHNKVFDFFAKRVLKRSKIYVREQASYNYLQSIGITCKLGVDTAFSLLPVKNREEKANKKYSIGLVPTLLNWHPQFQGRDMVREILENIIPGIASFCENKQYSIDIIPHIGSNEELTFISQVAKKLEQNGMEKKNIHIRTDVKTAKQYDEALASEYIVVGMRYHSIVLAAKNAVPFLAIAYENKMKEVSRYTNCEINCLDLQKRINPNEIKNHLMQIDNEHDMIVNQLKKVYWEKLFKLSRLPLQEIK